MNIHEILDRLDEAQITVWLDEGGNLRISKGAADEIKHTVRKHKQLLLDLRLAQDFMNSAGVRIKRMPSGGFALLFPPEAPLDRLHWAAATLEMQDLPLLMTSS